MDANRFDDLARTLTATPTRRGVSRALAGLTLSGMLLPLIGLADTEARKKKKNRKGKKKKGRNPSSTCTDGTKNGSETGVDCGGNCPRCANGQGCLSRDDCAGALCIDGTCQVCTPIPDNCGGDDGGVCFCSQPESSEVRYCVQGDPTGDAVTSCTSCPPGTHCFDYGPASIYCYKLCGAS